MRKHLLCCSPLKILTGISLERSLFARLALWAPPEQRAKVFARRLAFENKERCHSVKRRIYFMASHLSRLYAQGRGASFAAGDLERMVVGMIRASNRVASLMSQVSVLFPVAVAYGPHHSKRSMPSSPVTLSSPNPVIGVLL